MPIMDLSGGGKEIDKKHMKDLIEIPTLNELNKDKIIKTIQKNSNNYAKIKVLLFDKVLNTIYNKKHRIQTLDTFFIKK